METIRQKQRERELADQTNAPNKIVDRTAASLGIPDMITLTTSTTSLGACLRRRSLTIVRWAIHPLT